MASLIYGTTDRTQGVLNYNTSQNATSVTITASSDFQAKSYYQSGYQITTTVGDESKSATDYIRNLYYEFTTAFSTGSVTKTYSRGYSQYDVIISSSYVGKGSGGYLAGSKSGNTSVAITIPAKESYSVTYNANGGSGVPGSQTKWYDEDLKLSSTVPTRSGYAFVGWGTSASDTSKDYDPNGTYKENKNLNLYAIWVANTYVITYNANGGTDAPSPQTKTYGVTLSLSSTKPTRQYYNFLGWSTSSSATTAQYSAGGNFTANADTTLYAVWQLAYTKPNITSVNIYRSDASGASANEGTYITYKFNWSIFASVSIKSIQLQYKLTTISSWTTGTTLTPSGSSGSVDTTVGGGDIDTTKSYNVRIVVTDTKDSSQYLDLISTAKTYFDVDTVNNAVAVGKYAEKPNTFEIALDVEIAGKTLLDNIYPVGSIYLAYSHTSPASLFGGAWTRIVSSFLWSGGENSNIGDTGGEYEHTLTQNEMPYHEHYITEGGMTEYVYTSTKQPDSNGATFIRRLSVYGEGYTSSPDSTYRLRAQAVGGSAAHNNMPPYTIIQAWRRIA